MAALDSLQVGYLMPLRRLYALTPGAEVKFAPKPLMLFVVLLGLFHSAGLALGGADPLAGRTLGLALIQILLFSLIVDVSFEPLITGLIFRRLF